MKVARVEEPVPSVLSIRAAVKRFGPTTALDGVTFDVRSGEVVGLVGANGAGKTTLIRLISGVEPPTSGDIAIDGEPVGLSGPEAARAAGIETVHQAVEEALVSDLTVAENLVLEEMAAGDLGRFPGRRSIVRRARELSAELFDVDLGARIDALDPSARQQVLITRALASRPRFLVLDEPSASLSVPDRRRLHRWVRSLAAKGTGVIFITHHLDELDQVCDRAVVLRDGTVTGRFDAPFRRQALVGAILGKLVETAPGAGPRRVSTSPPLFEGVGLTARHGAVPFDLSVASGEVVGITGLLGAGKTELLSQLFGSTPLLSGEMRFDRRRYAPDHPASAIAAGLGFVPEDRATSGLVPGWPVSWNVTLPAVATSPRRNLLSRSPERAVTRSAIDRLEIVCTGPDADVATLSGGNQQKVVIARWLAGGVRLLLLDEPFRGIDIGARADIDRLLRSGAVEAAVVASTDPEEVLEVADRVLVMAGGTVVGEVDAATTDPDGLAFLMAGGDR